MKILGTKSRRSPSSSIDLPAYTPRGKPQSPVHPPRRTVHFPALYPIYPVMFLLPVVRQPRVSYTGCSILSLSARFACLSVLCTLAPGRRSAHNAQRNSIRNNIPSTTYTPPTFKRPPHSPHALIHVRIAHHYYHHVTVRCFRFVQHTNQPMFSSVGRTVCPLCESSLRGCVPRMLCICFALGSSFVLFLFSRGVFVFERGFSSCRFQVTAWSTVWLAIEVRPHNHPPSATDAHLCSRPFVLFSGLVTCNQNTRFQSFDCFYLLVNCCPLFSKLHSFTTSERLKTPSIPFAYISPRVLFYIASCTLCIWRDGLEWRPWRVADILEACILIIRKVVRPLAVCFTSNICTLFG